MVLQKEQLVDAILLQRAELDEEADGAGEGALDDQVLLAPDLLPCECGWNEAVGEGEGLRTASRSWSKSRRALSVMSWVFMVLAAGCAAITY